jgi:zinc/manganese transport system substrate-binding protein
VRTGISGRSVRLAVSLAAAVLTVAAAGCGSSPDTSGGRIKAVAGENFYGDLVARVGGDLVSVTTILKDPNIEPHSYESTPQDAQAVADATLVVENGLGYDAFLDHLMGASPRSDRKVVNVAQVLGKPDGSNPHVWYDPATMPKVARAVATAIEGLRPESSSIVEANLATYLASFGSLTARVDAVRAAYPATPVAYTEAVVAYLLDALGFTVLSPAGFARAIENGTDPSPGDVAAFRDLLTEKKVKLLLYNNQATSAITESLETLARDSGVAVVGVSETMPEGEGGYVDWQLTVLGDIETALAGSQ